MVFVYVVFFETNKISDNFYDEFKINDIYEFSKNNQLIQFNNQLLKQTSFINCESIYLKSNFDKQIYSFSNEILNQIQFYRSFEIMNIFSCIQGRQKTIIKFKNKSLTYIVFDEDFEKSDKFQNISNSLITKTLFM